MMLEPSDAAYLLFDHFCLFHAVVFAKVTFWLFISLIQPTNRELHLERKNLCIVQL